MYKRGLSSQLLVGLIVFTVLASGVVVLLSVQPFTDSASSNTNKSIQQTPVGNTPGIPGLTQTQQNQSAQNITACNDNRDNDGDGWKDESDPGCTILGSITEVNIGTIQCSDGIDNNDTEDALIDGHDPDCEDAFDTSEALEIQVIRAECEDGVDNDGDSWIDVQDGDCTASGAGQKEQWFALSECSDGMDNDGDGSTDRADSGCANAQDMNERDNPGFAGCADGIDNDNDGLTDYPIEPGCSGFSDGSEDGESRGAAASKFSFSWADNHFIEVNYTDNAGQTRRIIWDEFTRTRTTTPPSPSYVINYPHSLSAQTYPNLDAIQYTLKNGATRTLKTGEVTYSTPIQEADRIQVQASSSAVQITDDIRFHDDKIYITTKVSNQLSEAITLTFDVAVFNSLMLGNFGTDLKIVNSNTGLTRYANGIETNYGSTTNVRSSTYPSIDSIAPVSILWDNRTTFGVQLLTPLYLPDKISFSEHPFNAHSPMMGQKITLHLAAGQTRSVVLVLKVAEGAGNWQGALQPYKTWFNAHYAPKPAYCPASPWAYMVGANAGPNVYDAATRRYKPGLTLEQIYSADKASTLAQLGVKWYGIWQPTYNSKFLTLNGQEDEFSAMMSILDPNIDASANSSRIKDFVNAFQAQGTQVFWYARPCATIYGASMRFDSNGNPVVTRGTLSGYNDVDLRNVTNRDNYIAQIKRFTDQGVRGLYYDATGCPGDEAFFVYAQKKLAPNVSLTIMEGTRDRTALSIPTMPFVKTGPNGGTFSLNLTMLLPYLVPDGTYYAGAINNVLVGREYDAVADAGFQVIPANYIPAMSELQNSLWNGTGYDASLGSYGSNFCRWVQKSYQNQLQRWNSYGHNIAGCAQPQAPPSCPF